LLGFFCTKIYDNFTYKNKSMHNVVHGVQPFGLVILSVSEEQIYPTAANK